MGSLVTKLTGWLRHLLGGGAVRAEQARAEAAADQAIVQSVLEAVLTRHGIRPHYVPELTSEEDAVKAAQSLPLFYVWGQHETDSGTQFTFGLNGLMVSGALGAHAEPGSPRFKRLKARIERKLHSAAYDALVAECDALELTPRDLLDIHRINHKD